MNVAEKGLSFVRDQILSFHESVYMNRHKHYISLGIGIAVLLAATVMVLQQAPKGREEKKEERSYLFLEIAPLLSVYLVYLTYVVLSLRLGSKTGERQKHLKKGLNESIYVHRRSYLISIAIAASLSATFLLYDRMTEKPETEFEEKLSQISIDRQKALLVLFVVYATYVLGVIYVYRKKEDSSSPSVRTSILSDLLPATTTL